MFNYLTLLKYINVVFEIEEARLPIEKSITFGSFICECFGNHLIESAFINTYVFAAGTLNFLVIHLRVIHLLNAVFMAAQHFAWANFVISPQFLFAGGAVNGQHNAKYMI